MRAFECSNAKTNATLTFGFDVKEALLCDMSENVLEALDVVDNSVTLTFKPFEIHTIKVR